MIIVIIIIDMVTSVQILIISINILSKYLVIFLFFFIVQNQQLKRLNAQSAKKMSHFGKNSSEKNVELQKV